MRSLVWSVMLLCLVSAGYGATAAKPKPAPAPKSVTAPKPAPPPRACSIPPGKSAIVIFERHLATGDDAEDIYLAAQKVSGDGKLLWEEGAGWVDVAVRRGGLQRRLRDPRWQGRRHRCLRIRARSGRNAGDCDLQAQRMDADGRLLWNGGDPVGVADTSADEVRPFAVTDGAGGVIVVYEKHEGVSCYSPRPAPFEFGGHRLVQPDGVPRGHQRLQPEASLGGPVRRRGRACSWSTKCATPRANTPGTATSMPSASPVAACDCGRRTKSARTVSSAEKTLERKAAWVPDGDRGFIAVFEDEWRSGEYVGDWDIYGQRLDGNGKMLWNDGDKSAMVSSAKHLERAS